MVEEVEYEGWRRRSGGEGVVEGVKEKGWWIRSGGEGVVDKGWWKRWRRRDGGGEVVEEKGRNSENEAVGGLGDGRRWRRVVMRLLAQITLNTETSCKKTLKISLV